MPARLLVLMLLVPYAVLLTPPAVAQIPLTEKELQDRRKKLEEWTFEPVVLEGGNVRLQMDRRDSSFFIQERRSNATYFSSLDRRGYAEIELDDGRKIPVDRCESLQVSGERIRFLAASSAGELPPLWLEIHSVRPTGGLSLTFDIPEESRERVASVKLLDEALWTSDSEAGGVVVPRGMGEWLAADREGDAYIRLDGFPQLVRQDPAGQDGGLPETGLPETSYTAPLLGIRKGQGTILVAWDEPDVSVEIVRRAVDDERFPGRRGVFVSLKFRGDRGTVQIVGGALPLIGPLDIARLYQQIKAEETGSASLRYKTGASPELRTLLGAVFFRPGMTTSPRVPSAVGEARYSFDEVARIAERLGEKLEIDQALFLLNDWLGSGSEEGEPLLSAARECGGNAGLADCARRIRKAGYLFGLSLHRDQLIRDATPGGLRPVRAWNAALETARSPGGFPALKSLCSPQLLVVREAPPGVAASPRDLLESREELLGYAREMFSLWGTDLGSALAIDGAGYFENFFSRKKSLPGFTRAFPLFASTYGQQVRLAASPGEGLRPDDAAGVLHHLIFGEAPAFALPPHLYFEGPALEVGAGPEWCFAREGGWTEGLGLTPYDVFIKNVFEICSHVCRISARERLSLHRSLTPDGTVRESYFGQDMRIVVNFGPAPYEDEESKAVLPQYGFIVRYPFFHAFHALRVGEQVYDTPAFFTVRSLEGKMYLRAEKTRLYHGFGPDIIRLGGKEFRVQREKAVKIW